METYKIIRFYYPTVNKSNRVIKRGLTLEEVQKYCQGKRAQKVGVYFDDYEAE